MIRSALVLLFVFGCVVEAGAQSADTLDVRSLEARLLYGIYEIEHPVFVGYVQAVDASAYPVFLSLPFVAIPLAWLGGSQDDLAPAYRAVVSEVVALAGAMALKKLYRRPRPYLALPDITQQAIEARVGRLDRAVLLHDPNAFPSGHATLAFALAVSASLSYPVWYVIGPGALWAGGVALSRVWQGVHYPGDVLAGALLGSVVAVGVHLLRGPLTPDFLEREGKTQRIRAPVLLRVRLP